LGSTEFSGQIWKPVWIRPTLYGVGVKGKTPSGYYFRLGTNIQSYATDE